MRDNYAYGVLEVRNGEGILSMMACENVDQGAFRSAGGTVKQSPSLGPVTCELDSASRPLEVPKNYCSKSPRP
jgi:hypothetical protein